MARSSPPIIFSAVVPQHCAGAGHKYCARFEISATVAAETDHRKEIRRQKTLFNIQVNLVVAFGYIILDLTVDNLSAV